MTPATVRADVAHATRGRLNLGTLWAPCILGRSGIVAPKREGDGGTPRGVLRLMFVFYRADRLPRPRTALPALATARHDGWCDAPADPAYNRLVRLPHAGGHERLWRDDGVYDIVIVTDHNTGPVRPGAGSAIFLHLTRDDGAPTAGCIALSRRHMLALLSQARPGQPLRVG